MTEPDTPRDLSDRALLEAIFAQNQQVLAFLDSLHSAKKKKRPGRDKVSRLIDYHLPDILARPTADMLLKAPKEPKPANLFLWYLHQPEHGDRAYSAKEVAAGLRPFFNPDSDNERAIQVSDITFCVKGFRDYRNNHLLQIIPTDLGYNLYRAKDLLPEQLTKANAPPMDMLDADEDFCEWVAVELETARRTIASVEQLRYLYLDIVGRAMDPLALSLYMSDHGWEIIEGTHRPESLREILIKQEP